MRLFLTRSLTCLLTLGAILVAGSLLVAVAADKKKGDAAARAAVRKQAAGQALGVFCQSLLASNLFLYID